MVDMGWSREDLEEQDPRDLDGIMEYLSVRRLAAAPERLAVLKTLSPEQTTALDLAMFPEVVEEMRRRLD